jgi:hypothetical protein
MFSGLSIDSHKRIGWSIIRGEKLLGRYSGKGGGPAADRRTRVTAVRERYRSSSGMVKMQMRMRRVLLGSGLAAVMMPQPIKVVTRWRRVLVLIRRERGRGDRRGR